MSEQEAEAAAAAEAAAGEAARGLRFPPFPPYRIAVANRLHADAGEAARAAEEAVYSFTASKAQT